MFNLLKFYISCCVLLLSLAPQLFAQKINIVDYKNKAQAYAILSAQYSADVYKLSRENYFLDDVSAIKQKGDSALLLSELALSYADSAFNVAHDSCVFAKNLLVDVRNYHEQSIEHIQHILKISDYNTIHDLTGETMYATGNAVTDAYRASLELEWIEDEPTVENTEKEDKRDVTRLETDEATFLTVNELYEKRLSEIDKEISLLEAEKNKTAELQRKEITDVITQLKTEQQELLNKSKNSSDRLVKVRNDLSDEMLKTVNKDFFTTDKTGFYNENVPIPTVDEFPKGLVYKVQIGFFKSKLPSKHYDGVFPISTQKVDKDYYKYLAGNFKHYTEAKEASILLRKKGYNDAFVVSYIDGVKVAVSEALKMEKEIK